MRTKSLVSELFLRAMGVSQSVNDPAQGANAPMSGIQLGSVLKGTVGQDVSRSPIQSCRCALLYELFGEQMLG